MTSAFPQTDSPFGGIAAPIPIEDRNTHIPAFYVRNPHREPWKIIVRDAGMPILGVDGNEFTVAHVAEERRWAIGHDGNVMDQSDFHMRLGQVRLEFFKMLRDHGNPNAKFEGNIELEHVPAVKDYVSMGVDPTDPSKLMQIGYDPNRTAGSKPETFFDSKGEKIEEARIDVLCKAYASHKMRKALSKEEIAEVEEHLGIDSSEGTDGIAAKLELLNDMREAGDIDDSTYIAKVAALTGKSSAPETRVEPTVEPEQVEEEPKVFIATCGLPYKTEKWRKRHERTCVDCKDIKAAAKNKEDTT